MDLKKLKTKLDKENISSDAYSLVGGQPWDKYCIEENYGKWFVYYSERGIRFQEKLFYNEDDACQHLYNLLIKDPANRIKK